MRWRLKNGGRRKDREDWAPVKLELEKFRAGPKNAIDGTPRVRSPVGTLRPPKVLISGEDPNPMRLNRSVLPSRT